MSEGKLMVARTEDPSAALDFALRLVPLVTMGSSLLGSIALHHNSP